LFYISEYTAQTYLTKMSQNILSLCDVMS